MNKLALVLTVAVTALVGGCSTPPASRTSAAATGAVTHLGTVAVNDGGWYECTLSGGRNCRVCLRALADHRVLVEVVVLRKLSQDQAKVLARARTIASRPGQEVSLAIDEGGVALIPQVRLAAN
jgi:hypothetical protein